MPNFKDELEALNERFIDLLVPFCLLWYYDENFYGSFSIKSILLAFFPNDNVLNYKNLEINNGTDASNEYANIINLKSKNEIYKIRKNYLNTTILMHLQ